MAVRRRNIGCLTALTVVGLLLGVCVGIGGESDTRVVLCMMIGTMLGLISGIVIEYVMAKTAVPTRVSFQFLRSIQPDLPQCVCQVELSGEWTPQLPNDGNGYQNLCAWSDDRRFLALVRFFFDAEYSYRFRFCVIDIANRSLAVSQPIAGCCSTLRWHGEQLVYTAVEPRIGAIELKETTPVKQPTLPINKTAKHPLDD